MHLHGKCDNSITTGERTIQRQFRVRPETKLMLSSFQRVDWYYSFCRVRSTCRTPSVRTQLKWPEPARSSKYSSVIFECVENFSCVGKNKQETTPFITLPDCKIKSRATMLKKKYCSHQQHCFPGSRRTWEGSSTWQITLLMDAFLFCHPIFLSENFKVTPLTQAVYRQDGNAWWQPSSFEI